MTAGTVGLTRRSHRDTHSHSHGVVGVWAQRGPSKKVYPSQAAPSANSFHPSIPCELISPNHNHFPMSALHAPSIATLPHTNDSLHQDRTDGVCVCICVCVPKRTRACVFKGQGRSERPREPAAFPRGLRRTYKSRKKILARGDRGEDTSGGEKWVEGG